VAERDWSKELAKIDRKIGSMPDDQLLPKAPPPAGTGDTRRASPAAAPPAGARTAPAKPAKATGAFGVYARLALAVALGLAMIVWPYQARCGFGLAAYLAAVAVVVVGGGWSAIWTWRHRAARAHVLSLLILLWGLVLGSLEVLPRIGYAKPDVNHPAGWVCK
jgi:hypothetical protein